MSLRSFRCWPRNRFTSLAALALLALSGCVAPVKPPPLPPSVSSNSASPSGVVPATVVMPDGTKVPGGTCGTG